MAGRPADRSDEEILSAFADADGQALTTPEVKSLFSYSQSGIWRRLNSLSKAGYLTERKTGKGNATLWILTDDGRAYLSGEIDPADLEE